MVLTQLLEDLSTEVIPCILRPLDSIFSWQLPCPPDEDLFFFLNKILVPVIFC